MHTNVLIQNCIQALENSKAVDIKILDVTKLTDVTDTIIICSGTSNTHIKSLSNNLVTSVKEKGFKPLGIEGGDLADWVLVDLGDVIVHVMLSKTREFYDLESLWEYSEEDCMSLSA